MEIVSVSDVGKEWMRIQESNERALPNQSPIEVEEPVADDVSIDAIIASERNEYVMVGLDYILSKRKKSHHDTKTTKSRNEAPELQ